MQKYNVTIVQLHQYLLKMFCFLQEILLYQGRLISRLALLNHQILSQVLPHHLQPVLQTPYHLQPCHRMAHHLQPCHRMAHHLQPCHRMAHHLQPGLRISHHHRPDHHMPHHLRPGHRMPLHLQLDHIREIRNGIELSEQDLYQVQQFCPKSETLRRSNIMVNQNIRELNNTVYCVTCNGQFSLHIYQCTNGHSSCDGCRFKMARCGNCTEPITDMRNITLESTLADLTINTEERIKCPNAKDGCRLHFKREELQNHLKECPFNVISCPVMEFSGDCNWKGMIKQLSAHFNDTHPKHLEADVNKEMHIIVLELDYKVMHLVNLGFYKFLVHIQLDTSLNNIYMVTQYLGTNLGASNWTYEWHVYNKKEPRRKFQYIDVCKSNATPLSEIVSNNNCAVINMDYAKTFLDSGKLTFKFYLKKQFDNRLLL